MHWILRFNVLWFVFTCVTNCCYYPPLPYIELNSCCHLIALSLFKYLHKPTRVNTTTKYTIGMILLLSNVRFRLKGRMLLLQFLSLCHKYPVELFPCISLLLFFYYIFCVCQLRWDCEYYKNDWATQMVQNAIDIHMQSQSHASQVEK